MTSDNPCRGQGRFVLSEGGAKPRLEEEQTAVGGSTSIDAVKLCCKKLFYEDWGNAPEEEREKIRLFEVEVEGRICKYDMELFDRAYERLNHLDSPDGLKEIFEIARAYFRGDCAQDAVIEILSDGKAVAFNDITELLI